MTNEEKILQILSDMSNRLVNIEQEVVKTTERLTGVEQEVEKTSERLTGFEKNTNERFDSLKQEVVKTNLMVENDIAKRLNLLSDGYILTHEKQHELEWKFEHRIEAVEKRVEQLEIKAG